MSAGTVIHNLLSNDATVSGIVSTRIYPDTAPQNASFPYVVYQITGTIPTNDKDGTSKLDTVIMQIDAYSTSYDTTRTLADAIRTELDRYSGTNGTTVVDKIIFSNESSGPPDLGLGVFWLSQDYEIRIKR